MTPFGWLSCKTSTQIQNIQQTQFDIQLALFDIQLAQFDIQQT